MRSDGRDVTSADHRRPAAHSKVAGPVRTAVLARHLPDAPESARCAFYDTSSDVTFIGLFKPMNQINRDKIPRPSLSDNTVRVLEPGEEVHEDSVVFLVLDTMKICLQAAVDDAVRSESLHRLQLDKEGSLITNFCFDHVEYVQSVPVQIRASECLGV